MALSPGEEQAFRALIKDIEHPVTHRLRWFAWTAVVTACLAGIGSAGALDAPWLAALGWLGLIAAGLAGVAAPSDGRT